jgi:transcriptional regulator of arginine metabolism
VKDQPIHSQEQLRKRLREHGVEVTQATLSRDLQSLGIVRVFERESGYVYRSPRAGSTDLERERAESENLIRGIRDIQFSGNLAVIKTDLGHATGIAFEIDQLEVPDILGTVGGDDTLVVVFRENSDHSSLLRALDI